MGGPNWRSSRPSVACSSEKTHENHWNYTWIRSDSHPGNIDRGRRRHHTDSHPGSVPASPQDCLARYLRQLVHAGIRLHPHDAPLRGLLHTGCHLYGRRDLLVGKLNCSGKFAGIRAKSLIVDQCKFCIAGWRIKRTTEAVLFGINL